MRAWRIALGAVLALAVLAPAASAHPLGNFSVNHLSEITISRTHVDVRWVLDQAEIPTFQERDLTPAAVLARKRAEALRGLSLMVDGRPVTLAQRAAGQISFPPGQGGLKLTRVVLELRASVHDPRNVTLNDGTFPDRVGWKAIEVRPGADTAVRSSAPSGDVTHELRAYPQDQLSSPLDMRSAKFTVRPGGGTLTAPATPGGQATTTNRGGDGLAGVFERAVTGRGALLLLLLAAFAWGAIHALSPGHGKTMVAAYLVGTRGTAKHALALGAVTTITHTIGVFALGLVTLLLAQYVVPEDLYPWLNLVSGVMVISIGALTLRSRVRWGRAQRARASEGADAHEHAHVAEHGHGHSHEDEHEHAHGHDHAHGHAHDHAHSHGGGRPHHHHPPQELSWRGLIAMGASAGIIPCPSALVVLLGAIAQHQIALGLLLIVLFSLGLATTLTALGMLVVFGRRATARLSFTSRYAAALPALSTLLIIGLGLVLTAKAIPTLV